MSILYHNGDYVDATKVKISPYSMAFQFGWGAFESFRSWNGKLKFLDEHLARLQWAITYLQLPEQEIDLPRICTKLLETSVQKNQDARFKLIYSATLESMTDVIDFPHASAERASPDIVVYCEPLTGETAKPGTGTIRLKTCSQFHAETSPLAVLKLTNYLTKRLAYSEAREAGYDDAILTTREGQATETTTANIWWIDAERKLHCLHTGSQALDGVMQRQLLQLLKTKDVPVIRSGATVSELSSAREVFVTNAVRGIQPVTHIDDRKLSGGTIGDVTHMILDLFNKWMTQ